MQNVSKGNKSRVKELFVSRYPGGSIIQSDFTSLEVYIQAWLSMCKNLINDLKAGVDMHCMRLATKEKMPYEEVLKLCKGPTAVKEWEYKRTAAKVLSFQKAYGAGNTKIAESTGMSLEEVEAFSAAEDERYPEIQAYFKRLEKECKAHAKPQRVIKHPLFPNMICHIGKAVLKTPDGKAYAYFQEPAPGWLVKKGITASFSPTQIKNYSVQGMGAEVAKAAMALVLREFAKRGNFHGLACIVNQCHDAIYVDAHPDVFKEAAQVLHTCMTQASTYFEELFKWEIPVPVPAETKAGSCMAEENVLDFLY